MTLRKNVLSPFTKNKLKKNENKAKNNLTNEKKKEDKTVL